MTVWLCGWLVIAGWPKAFDKTASKNPAARKLALILMPRRFDFSETTFSCRTLCTLRERMHRGSGRCLLRTIVLRPRNEKLGNRPSKLNTSFVIHLEVNAGPNS